VNKRISTQRPYQQDTKSWEPSVP